MNHDSTVQFDLLLQSYVKTIENNCLAQFKKAKDKIYVADRILNQLRGIIRFYSLVFTKHNKACNYFIEKYNRGEEIELIIKNMWENYPEAMKMAPEIDERDNIELIPFNESDEQMIRKFPSEMQAVVAFNIGYLALSEILKRLPGYLNQTENTISLKYPMKWTGSENNKNEFVQLIYGLHEAGLINNGKGEITKITEALAETLELDLGKHWQSNLSASIHKANMEYQPPIFDKIKEAYLKYAEKLAYDKKRKK
ncbi:MAG: RteC domain-containing protein [Bacteroidota bacterium]|nr:RteC domain-containing protein [Bacteroidota bacterium]MDP3556872.1 RteC domain-containing protein [Bacteroidota bacterium]